MAILSIARMGHPVLRGIAERVEEPTDPEIARLAADMRNTLEHIAPCDIGPLFQRLWQLGWSRQGVPILRD